MLNTKIKIDLGAHGVVGFAYEAGKPSIQKNGKGVDVVDEDVEAFHRLLDFTQYSETELAKAQPPGYVPVKKLQLIAACKASKPGSEAWIATLASHAGPKLKYQHRYRRLRLTSR